MLPRETSIKQLKMLRDLTKGVDIGDLTSKDRLNMDQPNLQYVGNPVDKHIDSYEEFEERDSKLQTIAFRSKLVNKPLLKDELKEQKNYIDMKNKIIKFENFLKEEKKYTTEYIKESFYEWYNNNKESEILRDEYREYVYELKYSGEEKLTFRQWCKNKYDSLIEFGELESVKYMKESTDQPEYEILGKEKELKSNPLFGVAAVKDEENKKIAFFNNFQIDPPTPKERSILNAGQFIDNDKVKGFVNRIEGKDVYIESVDEPMVIKKFSLNDAVKTKKDK